MRDTIAGKAARHMILHEKDCGKCANCLEVAQCRQDYDSLLALRTAESIPKDIIDRARHTWLEVSRLKRCLVRQAKGGKIEGV